MKNNCKKYEKWLYLHREGELTNRQAVKLAKHLQTCSECSKVSRQLEQLHQDIVQVNKYNELDNFQLNIAGPVLNSIRILNKNTSHIRATGLDGLLDIFARPAMQVVSLVLVIFICLSLIFQETSVMLRIADLEERMTEFTEQKSTVINNIDYQRILDRLFYNSEIHRGILTNTISKEQYIVVDKELVEIWLKSYQQTRLQNEILLQFLQMEYPELLELMHKDSLSISDLDRALYKHKDILTKLKQL